MLVFALVACVAPEGLTPEAGTVRPVVWEALASPERSPLAGRAWPVHAGALRLSDAGPAVNVPPEDELWLPSYAVVEADAGVRVRLDEGGLRLLPWLDRADLQPVIAESAWVGADGARVTAGKAGVLLPVGLPVDVDADGPSHTLGRWPLRGRVALPGSMIDEWYDPAAPVLSAEPAHSVALLLAPTTLRDEAGRVLAEVDLDVDALDVALLERRGDARLVQVTSRHPCAGGDEVVRGWVDHRVLDEHPTSLVGFGFGCCCGGMGFGRGWGTTGPTVTLPPERLLWDAPDGDVVGVVLGHDGEAVTLPEDTDAGDMPGWVAVQVHSSFGPLTVWAKTEGGMLDELVPPEAADPEGVATEDGLDAG